MSKSTITKKALAGALRSLMQTHSLEKITVGEICDACGMSRKGFYYHFKDKYDLVNWIFVTEFMSVIMEREDLDGWTFLKELCSYFAANRSFYINAFRVQGQNSFDEYFGQTMEPLAETYFRQTFAEADGDFGFYARFFVDGFRVAIIRWLRDGCLLSPEEFVGRLQRAASGVARHYAADLPLGE